MIQVNKYDYNTILLSPYTSGVTLNGFSNNSDGTSYTGVIADNLGESFVDFIFYGRIIKILLVLTSDTQKDSSKIYIDGNDYGYLDTAQTTSDTYHSIGFSMRELPNGFHHVHIEHDSLSDLKIEAIYVDFFHHNLFEYNPLFKNQTVAFVEFFEKERILGLTIGDSIYSDYVYKDSSTIGRFINFSLTKSFTEKYVDINGWYHVPAEFVFIGYSMSGAYKFIAKDNIQEGLTWEAINSALKCTSDGSLFLLSNYTTRFKIRLLQSKSNKSWPDASSEWDSIFLKGPVHRNDKQFWGVKPSWTMSVGSNTSNRVIRGGDSLDLFKEVSSTSKGGYRPVLEVQFTPITQHKDVFEPVFPIANDLRTMSIGEAIKCFYYADTAGKLGNFSFIGTNITNQLLTDIPQRVADGYFYFIFVGYNMKGWRKFVADRNIQSYLSADALETDNELMTSSGYKPKIEGLLLSDNYRIRLPNAAYADTTTNENAYELDKIIYFNDILDEYNGRDDAWNLNGTHSLSIVDIRANNMYRYTVGGVSGNLSIVSHGKILSSQQDDLASSFRPIFEFDASLPEEKLYRIPEVNIDLVNNVFGCSPGQGVTCAISVTETGTVGKLYGLATKDESIPWITDPVTEGTYEGKFVFVCVGHSRDGGLKFVADRVIQGNISWDQLSDLGYCTFSGADAEYLTKSPKSYLRILQSAKYNKSISRESSEYDTILFKETIGATDVSQGKIDYWNQSLMKTWCLETASVEDYSGKVFGPSYRIVRGGGENYDNSDIRAMSKNSDYKSYTVGFRPVLVIAPDSKPEMAYLVADLRKGLWGR